MMANRFGRQQKRKMRAEFAEKQLEVVRLIADKGNLKRQVDRLQVTVTNQLHKIMMLQGEIDRAKNIIGSNSVLFAPSVLSLGAKEVGFVRVPTMGINNPNSLCDDWELGAVTSRLMMTTLDVLLSDTAIRQFDFGYHCQVDFNGKRWAYACDEKAIMSMPRSDLVQLMANSLAHQIVDDLKSNKAR